VLEECRLNKGRSVNASNPILQYWWFHLPNLVLAMLMYTAIGRFVLGFIFDDHSTNFIWRFFVKLTDPMLKLVKFVTPASVPDTIVLLLSVVWLFGLRVVLLVSLIAAGVGPTTGMNPQ
jgi:uncharacterized protein YggT (Ycf19 family)